MNIEERVRVILMDQLKPNVTTHKEIPLSNNLVSDLGADSLDMVEILVDCESVFKIDINEDDWSKSSKTVKGIVDLVKRYER